MADIEKILNKRKPTAKDTLELLLNDIVHRELLKIASEKGNIDKYKSFGLTNFKVVEQDKYSKIVLKLSEAEYKKHQNNVYLYNYYCDELENQKTDRQNTLLYFKVLAHCLSLETSIIKGDINNEEKPTEKTVTLLQWLIATNIRKMTGFNYFVETLIKYTHNDYLEITKTELTDIREAYKNYYKTYKNHVNALLNNSESIKHYAQLYEDEDIKINMALYEYTKEEIENGVKGLSKFDTINNVDFMKNIISKNTVFLIREGNRDELITKLKRNKEEINRLGITEEELKEI